MNTSEKIRYFRNKKSMSQKQLGEKSGVSEITIRKYEAGNVPTKLDTLAKIASALDVSLQVLGVDGILTHNETHTAKDSISIAIQIDTSQLDTALQKANELVSVLEKACTLMQGLNESK